MEKTAKAIIFERPRKAAVKSIRLPEADERAIITETTRSGISLGTEMKLYRGLSSDKAPSVWYPHVPGYECVGRVVHVGAKALPQDGGYLAKVGDRVMVNEMRVFPDYCAAWGGQVGMSVKNPVTAGGAADGLAKIPDNVTDEQAVCAYLGAVALKGIKRVKPQNNETVLVVGCGQIGISAIQLAKIAAKCTVIAVDNRTVRVERARQFADVVVDASATDPVKAVRDATNGRGVDVIIECSGNPDVIDSLKFYAKGGGWKDDDPPVRIHLQGDYPRPIILTTYDAWFCTNATITMTCAAGPGHKTEILSLMSQGKFSYPHGPFYDVDDAPRAYEETDKNYFDVTKPIFNWR